MPLPELELQLDAAEERRGRMEDERVRARNQLLREAQAPIRVGRPARHRRAVQQQLDVDPLRRLPGGGVEHVR